MSSSRRYLVYLFAFSGVLLSLHYCVIKYGFAPYGMNESLFGFENIISYRTDGRFVKTAKITNDENQYEIYMIGSSRLRDGLSTETAQEITQEKAFNYGISGLLASEMTLIVDHLLLYKKPETIIIGLDFFAFNDATKPSYTMVLEEKLFWKDILKLYLSSFSLKSAKNMWIQRKTKEKIFCSRDGYCEDKRFTSTEVAYYIQEGLKKMGQANDVLFNFQGYDKSMEDFESMLKALKDSDARVLFYHAPAHILYYKGLQNIGLLDTHLQWKEEISRKIYDYGFALWDFDIDSPATMLPLPESIRYFNDDLHYNKFFGDIILRTLFTGESNRFSVKLDHKNIKEHLARQFYITDTLQLEDFQ